MPDLSERQCYELIQRLISFPYNQICVNYAAGMVIEQMEKSGMDIDSEFCRLVVGAHDDEALVYLQQKLA
jgi:hypothetical protein